MSYYNKFKNQKYKNKSERNKLLKLIIDDCNSYNEIKIDLINIEKEIAVFCTENCSKCFSKSIKDEINWSYFCDKLNFKCSEDCELKNTDNSNSNIKTKFSEFKDRWIKKKLELNKSYYLIQTALIQQDSFLKTIKDNLTSFKKIKSILVLKKQYISFIINIIQISIIFISSLITFFESIKENLSLDSLLVKIISIAASTYIAFILAIFRFFKLDTINENLGKVIERYSFIINRLQDKYRTINSFDFKKDTVSEWNKLIDLNKKENIKDIITKTNQEKDILISLKEAVYYQNIYIQLKLKKEIDRFNFKKALKVAKDIKSVEDLNNLKSIKKLKCCDLNIFRCFKYKLDFDSFYKNNNIDIDQSIELNKINNTNNNTNNNIIDHDDIHKSISISVDD